MSQYDDFVLLSAQLVSTRNTDYSGEDIRQFVQNFSIYESILSPVLTLKLLITETHSLLEKFDFTGGERLTLRLTRPEDLEYQENIVEKTFRLTKIMNARKGGERAETISFHGVEEYGFASSVKNVNRAYSGKPGDIIKKITEEYLNKLTDIIGEEAQGNLKIIIPNLTPLESIKWISSRMTTSDGLPFYVYSTLGYNNILVNNLQNLLQDPCINEKTPYGFWQGVNNSYEDDKTRNYVIQNYKIENNDDIIGLIRHGAVGSEYNFFDITRGRATKIYHNVENVFQMLLENAYLSPGQDKFNYGPETYVDDLKLGEYNSNRITSIASSDVYGYPYKSIDQEEHTGSYNNKIVARSLHAFLNKTPITIQVPGKLYLSNKGNSTIGNKIKILFFNSIADMDPDKHGLDTKKSGDYIIYSTQHTFHHGNGNRHFINMQCVKLASITDNNAGIK
tara:strand:+ start:1218 stop:2567 length:1350 start_codon:yes stop_codon:yes gene_type:complete